MANSRFACMAITLLLCCVNGIVALDDTQQTKPKETPEKQEIKVKTELMEVRTVVTDKKGRIVEDLKKEDFELLENDQPQEISFFSVSKVESAPGKSAEPAHTEANAPEKAVELQPVQKRLNETPVRTTLLFVDNLHTSFASLNRIKEAVRRFIKERLTDQDMVALVTTGQTLGIAQQFTRNRQILNYAVEQIRLGPHLQDESSFPFKLSADILMNRGDSLRLGVAMIRQELNQICPCQVMVTLARNRPLQSLAEASNSRRVTLATLRGYAEQMINLPGKRMIVVFSDGFTMYDNDGAVHDNEVQPVIDRAVRSGVVVYSILARGLEGPAAIDAGKKPAFAVSLDQIDHVFVINPAQANPSGPQPYQCLDDVPACSVPPSQELYQSYVNMSEQEELNGLNSIAEATGGKMYNDTNDLGDALGRALEANRFYYVLSYYLTSRSNNNQFRRIKVRVRNHPEYTIRTARGFSAAETMAKEEDAGKTPPQRLMKSMNAPLPVTDLGVSAQADFLENGSDDKQVSLTVYFDGDRFKYREQDQLHHVELEIIYVVYDSSGKQVEGNSAHVEGHLTEERLAQAKTSGFRFSRRLSLKPGAYQVRIGVREEGTDRMGTASAWVEVPELEKERLQMSSLMLRNPLDTDPAAKEGMNVSELEQVKMVQGIPLYAHDDFCDYSFRVHRTAQTPAESGLTWMNELYQDGKLVKQEAWRPISAEEAEADNKGWLDLDGEVDLSGFNPGIYELRVSIKDAGLNKTIQRTTVFGIE